MRICVGMQLYAGPQITNRLTVQIDEGLTITPQITNRLTVQIDEGLVIDPQVVYTFIPQKNARKIDRLERQLAGNPPPKRRAKIEAELAELYALYGL